MVTEHGAMLRLGGRCLGLPGTPRSRAVMSWLAAGSCATHAGTRPLHTPGVLGARPTCEILRGQGDDLDGALVVLHAQFVYWTGSPASGSP